MKSLRRALHRPWSPPAPEFAVRLGCRVMHSEPALALTSTRCLPRRFEERGFMFEFGDLEGALQNLCG
jgi:NAD dependent epimerase/dehydratase family enzyme